MSESPVDPSVLPVPGSVAIAVLHFGDPSLAEACLRSTLPLDDAPAAARPAVRLLIGNDPQNPAPDLSASLGVEIMPIETGARLGFAGGANFAARAAAARGAEWLWLLSNDTEVAPDALAILLGAATTTPKVALAGPRIIAMADGRIWHDGGRILWPEARPISEGYDLVPGPAGDPHPIDFVCGCAPLIRLEPFLAVDGFDERYYTYYEDADLSMRLRAAGNELIHVPRAEVRHIGAASTGARSPSTRYYALRNRRLFRDLHAPDRVVAARHGKREARKMRARALRYAMTGRRAEADAIRAALADHAASRYGAAQASEARS